MFVLARLVAFAVGAWYITTTLLHSLLPSWFLSHSKFYSVSVAVMVLLMDRYYFYPQFYSPFRNLPIIRKTSAASVISEHPIGSSPLKWFKRFPDADVIVMREALRGKDLLYAASPRALRDVLSTNTYAFEKPTNVRSLLTRILGYGLVGSEGEPHKKQRKAMTPAFNIRNIRGLYGLMWDKTAIFLSQLESEMKTRGSVEMTGWCSRLTLDIIGPAALSRDFESLTSSDHQVLDAWAAILEPSREMVVFLVLNLLVPQWIVRLLPLNANKAMTRSCGFLRNLCHKILQEKHQALLSEKKDPIADETDILSNIIKSKAFTDDEVVDQMLTILGAGVSSLHTQGNSADMLQHETTAGAITWTCYLLAQNPQIQAKLRGEIHACIPSSKSSISYDILENMPYLNGVCEELLRLYPSAPATMRRAVRQTTIADVIVPKGTTVVIPIYAINRNPRFWGPDADEMVPERWIDSATARPNKHGGSSSNYCESTFLHGQRSCIGRDFAKAELRCAVAGIFGRFVVEMVDPDQAITISGLITTKPREGMHLKLKTIEDW
ncbi:Cytochrome P450 monooxygenase FUM15 [Lachnellula suecica]|uniref:Cytochrome P450 monooxygenase FUM15 n=1 Tax=Lachnellula suecica TaxID=602035 RepID=A0A8T9BTL1_9HELO|nr:Cytochrome P450 monooxygenase FUM15 [Lachnellula suecica]